MKNLLVNFFKDLYLVSVKISSLLSYKKHNKIIFLLSFPTTSKSILEELYNEYQENLIICYTRNSSSLAQCYEKKCEIYLIDRYDLLLRKVVPYIKGANVILADNYFAFLAPISLKNNVKVVQVWHANGAIKKFGLEANYTRKNSRKDKIRYKKVYDIFTHYVVSSDKMKKIFENNYKLPINTLNFGYPQTDYYLDSNWMSEKKKLFHLKFQGNKKVLLYAPTYRIKKDFRIYSVLEKLVKLSEEWMVIVKLHPHDFKRYNLEIYNSSLIFDFQGLSLQEILPSVDCLITDYSSIPFEYTLANKIGKIIFYCFDYQEYITEVGIESDFLKWAPGKVLTTDNDLIKEVNSNVNYDWHSFNKEWNQYVNGTAKKQLIKWVRDNNV